MPDRPPFPVRRPLGQAIRRTAAGHAEAARITRGDIDRGRMRWHETAPRGHEGLIEATLEPERE
jgi:hypothetical protein